VIVLIYYYNQEAEYRKEIDKINKLENQKRLQQLQLSLIKAESTPCPVGNFTSPRSCYIDSGYSCTWNDVINRCDSK
jgi:hypothetical protein